MIRLRHLLVASALLLPMLNSCKAPSSDTQARPAGEEKLATIQMEPAIAFLSPEEREVINLLNQAAALMSEIYKRQATPGYDQLRTRVAGEHPQVLDRFDRSFGPWDPIEENKPFVGTRPKPAGAGFYPEDLTKEQFEQYLAAHPQQAEALTSPYTVVKRRGAELIAVPYSQEYRQWLEPAAQLLRKAGQRTSNASLRRFLLARAQAFGTDDYFQSELAWMNLEGTPIEVAIGPYEVYTDGLFGRKTAFEAFITVKDPAASQALSMYKSHLRGMEANLPVEEQYKNFGRGFESPIVVADQVQGGGDNVPGVQTVAFNLPNDERVREAKGAKKVILRNVLDAKYQRILKPMAALVLVPEQAGQVTSRYMFMGTLFHELSHSLGPGTIVVGGRKTTVDRELKDIASGFEEAKADVMGAYNILYMMDKGVIPQADRPQLRATYVAGLFRAMRFGVTEAHGRGAAMQYRYLRNKGALAWNPGQRRYRLDDAKLDAAIRDLVADIIRLQGNGDYAGAKAFMARWGVADPQAQQVIGELAHIPTDIRPVYPQRV